MHSERVELKRQASQLFIPSGQFNSVVPAEAERLGIAVVRVPEAQLLVLIGQARESFKEHFGGGSALFENLEDGAAAFQFVEWFPGVTMDQVKQVLDHAARAP